MLIDDDDVEEAIAYLDFEPTTTDVAGVVWMCLGILSVAKEMMDVYIARHQQ